MQWNVFVHGMSSGKIEKYNIFDHRGFSAEVKKAFSEFETRDAFEKELQLILMYYFWAKVEWETVICQFVGQEDARKIDVYKQVMLNWEPFADYVWNSKGEDSNVD